MMAARYATDSIGYDVEFGLNEFSEPTIISDIRNLKNILLFILFTKPGQYPSLPMIGLNIEQYLYSYYDDIDTDDLKNQIVAQCSMLDQYVNNNTIEIRKIKYNNQPMLLIDVNGTETYPNGYKYNNQNTVNGFTIGISYDKLKNMIYNINPIMS